MTILETTPVIVGVGQTVSHWKGEDGELVPSPLSLAVSASERAFNDVSADKDLRLIIDTVAFVRLHQDSLPTNMKPRFGTYENLPGSLAEELGIKSAKYVYSFAGGDQPQKLVNKYAEALFDGTTKAVLLAGAEALGVEKIASRKKTKLNWSVPSNLPLEDEGRGKAMLSKYEIANGLGFPVNTYPIFDNAYRKRRGLSREQYRRDVADLLAPFSTVAATNPYAQFPKEYTAEFLESESKNNYRLTDTYLKWHVAQNAVNQAASVIMTTVKTARELGIPEEKFIYLHGYAQADDVGIARRADLSRSKSIDVSIERGLEGAGLPIDELSLFDLYSCFPSVVFMAAETLGIDWRDHILTVTGGLPFFGGAGNNYSMHAIASMVEKLRGKPKETGLILANGGFITKHAVGIYSAKPKENWAPISSDDLASKIEKAAIEVIDETETVGQVESYTVVYGRSGPERGTVSVQTPTGRKLARFRYSHRATINAFLNQSEPFISEISLSVEDRKNWVNAQASIGTSEDERRFKYIKINRRDKILEITLNRPEAYNALIGPAHYEISEVIDEYERDNNLWCAIITGAGKKAFCSGNDLKVTARGGDIRTPRSGFAGLCSRYNREKPIIAAVNGVAMGGGLEIILACDLAIAEPHARFALPEVKVGLFAAAGGVQRLTRQIGTKAAMELILTGRHFDAEEARELGVINAISAPSNVLLEARSLAERILEVSPSAVRATKRVLNDFDALDYDLSTSMKNTVSVITDLMKTKDLKEGVTAFAEKRSPKWSNS